VKSETVQSPKQSVYKKLERNYGDTLQCPCRNIAINYGTFVKTIPSFHQVCSSNFVEQLWIDFVFGHKTIFIWPMDVRTSLSSMWQLIAAFCNNAMNMMDDALDKFAHQSFVTSTLLSEELLRTKTQGALDFLRQTTSGSLLLSRTAVHEITQANGFMTGLSTNYIANSESDNHEFSDIIIRSTTKYILKGSTIPCSCLKNGSCPMPGSFYHYRIYERLGLYDLNTIEANETLSGIVVDCLPVQMAFASSLECFYNRSCLNLIVSINSIYINVSILDKLVPTRFAPTTTIEELIDELFIEQILNETIYESYYLAC
jgi:hypothetical protein